ncbi:pyrimidine-nucleoside phosphorylase [Amedibacillus sp. YH-ame10]
MRFVDIIEKKKQRQELTKEELHFFIDGYVKDEIPDYQVSALLMAIYFNGMNEKETAILTDEMLNSGDRIDLSSIQGLKCDKHSTGGVGDKTSLSLAPMVAACGGKVAKMSGRGLGHTGGTLDKVESIDGFQVNLSQDTFIEQVNRIGLSLIGQSGTLVPADKKLYALRDVSATVNSIPLIASSIMSKKLAAGADTILLDVKFGEGAFMDTPEKAEELSRNMISIGHHFHKDVRAMISNMNQPLGNAIGNALEVKEAIATLKGEGPQDFTDLCLQAGSIMLVQSKLAGNVDEAREMLVESITSGRALKKLIEMVEAQSGNVEQIKDPSLLPQAKEILEITTKESGYIKDLHALKLGTLAMQLGAGRMVKEDDVDPAVGIVLNKKVGDEVQQGDILAYVHINQPLPTNWLTEFYDAFIFTKEHVEKTGLIYKIIND